MSRCRMTFIEAKRCRYHACRYRTGESIYASRSRQVAAAPACFAEAGVDERYAAIFAIDDEMSPPVSRGIRRGRFRRAPLLPRSPCRLARFYEYCQPPHTYRVRICASPLRSQSRGVLDIASPPRVSGGRFARWPSSRDESSSRGDEIGQPPSMRRRLAFEGFRCLIDGADA